MQLWGQACSPGDWLQWLCVAESLGCSFGVKHAALGIGCNGCVLLNAVPRTSNLVVKAHESVVMYVISHQCSFILFCCGLSPTEVLLGPAVLVVSSIRPSHSQACIMDESTLPHESSPAELEAAFASRSLKACCVCYRPIRSRCPRCD